jgi:hypothetical protein
MRMMSPEDRPLATTTADGSWCGRGKAGRNRTSGKSKDGDHLLLQRIENFELQLCLRADTLVDL